jgi:transcription elongation factor Elf1
MQIRSPLYRIRETRMERLHFTCPRTQQDIDVGIDSDLNTLLRIRNKHVLARCPVCGERHDWEVREARLLQAA